MHACMHEPIVSVRFHHGEGRTGLVAATGWHENQNNHHRPHRPYGPPLPPPPRFLPSPLHRPQPVARNTIHLSIAEQIRFVTGFFWLQKPLRLASPADGRLLVWRCSPRVQPCRSVLLAIAASGLVDLPEAHNSAMRFPWSCLRPFSLVAIWLLVVSCCVLLGEATGDEAQAVHDWDIRSLYRVRFQHITKRPPNPVHPRMVDRRSKLATRWAALKDRIAEFFPSRHTNPRTVITFDRLATDFVNVGIVKLAKVLDPPKPPKRANRKGKDSTAEPPSSPGADADEETVALPESSTKPTPADARPKRRVTLVMDLPDFLAEQDDSLEDEEEEVEEEDPNDLVLVKQSKRKRTPGLPSAPMKLICEGPCAASVAMADHGPPPPRTLITVTFVVSSLLCSAFLRM